MRRQEKACPRLSPHFCDCNILMPRPPKQARTPEVGAGGVAGEVQGPGLHACGLPPIRSSLDKPRRASSFGNTAGHTPFNSVFLCPPRSRFCDQWKKRMTPGLTVVLRQALESHCPPCIHKNGQATQDVI